MHCQSEELYKERSEIEQEVEEGGKVGRQLESPLPIPHDVVTDLGCINAVRNAENFVNKSEQVDFNLEYLWACFSVIFLSYGLQKSRDSSVG
jgi:hypothetical protein